MTDDRSGTARDRSSRRRLLGTVGAVAATGCLGQRRGETAPSTAGGREPSTDADTPTATLTDGEEFPNLVGAHYYTWYGTDPVNHWDGSYVGEPALGTYDSTDEAVIDRHVRWALGHGINWFSATWWGPGSYSTETLVDHVVEADLIDRLNVSVLYEPKGRFEYSAGRVDLDADRPRRVLREDFRHMERTLFDRDAYLTVDGRPVVYVYIANTFRGDVSGAFRDAMGAIDAEPFLIGDYGLQPQRPAAVFDAVSPYNVYGGNGEWATVLEESRRTNLGWTLLAEDVDFTYIPLVIPGFEKPAAPDLPVLERSPERFRDACRDARRFVDHDLRACLVTSFNEWHEGTMLEPGRDSDGPYGTSYLSVVAEELQHVEPGDPPTDELTRIDLEFSDTVRPVDVNPQSEDERELAFRCTALTLADGEAVVERYDIGASPEPMIVQGAFGQESTSADGPAVDSTWRWFGRPDRITTVAFPRETTAAADQLVLRGTPIDPAIRTTIRLGGERVGTLEFDSRDVRDHRIELR